MKKTSDTIADQLLPVQFVVGWRASASTGSAMFVSAIEAFDIFLRCAAVGQLILICALYLRRPLTGQRLSLLAVALCTAAYLLLTAPIANEHYGVLRNAFLVFTDALPYAIWLAAMYFFQDDFDPGRWPLPAKTSVVLFATWHVYFFGFSEGRGVFHDVNHGVAIVLLLHVLYVALQGLRDDLVDSRRETRILIAVLASLFGIYLALVELVGPGLRDERVFSILNAALIFSSILLLTRYSLGTPENPAPDIAPDAEPHKADTPVPIPPEFKALKRRLDEFMDSGGYRQSNLGIKELAQHLSCPEHHLRRLINAVLGFRNFSAFLNSRRIQDARERLADPEETGKPILTIALNLGYGSIGPFNRAFKAETGVTPSEYRGSFQNRR